MAGRIDYYHDPDAPSANSIVVAVTAFILDASSRLLMIRRTDNDLYAIPGRAQEVGETISQTVVREVTEETGILVEVTGLIGVYSDPEHIIAFANSEVRQEFCLCFRARPIRGEPRTSSESKEVLWVEPARLDDLNTHPSIRLRIQHGFEHNATPFYT